MDARISASAASFVVDWVVKDVLLEQVPQTPAADRDSPGSGTISIRAFRGCGERGQFRALPCNHCSQGMFQSPYPSSGASWVLVPVTVTMSP